MSSLIYSAITSLDGYAADADGNFDWAEPDEEVHTVVNDLLRPVGTYLYGRRMYEVMTFWESAHTLPDQPPFVREFAAIWQAADKVVYSRTPDHGRQCSHPDRAKLRPRRGATAEGVGRPRHHRGRARPCRLGHPLGTG